MVTTIIHYRGIYASIMYIFEFYFIFFISVSVSADMKCPHISITCKGRWVFSIHVYRNSFKKKPQIFGSFRLQPICTRFM